MKGDKYVRQTNWAGEEEDGGGPAGEPEALSEGPFEGEDILGAGPVGQPEGLDTGVPRVKPPPPQNLRELVRESLLGEALVEDWTPLSWRTLLTEGWDDPFVFSPASSSGALRQEWINAANGVFYRQWVLDYNYRNHVSPSGDRDLGSWFIFAPLSRRLELLFTVPFVDYHRIPGSVPLTTPGTGTGTGLGGLAGGNGGGRTGPYRAFFGDLSLTPQVMIHETKDTSIMGIMTVRMPTGTRQGGNGRTALSPQIQFWQGLPNRWVVRGGVGATVPLSAAGQRTTLDENLTVGKFLTTDKVRYFKEFTVYLAANVSTAVDNRGPSATTFTLLPGLRFRLTKETWFLYGVETAPGNQKYESYSMYFRFVKRF